MGVPVPWIRPHLGARVLVERHALAADVHDDQVPLEEGRARVAPHVDAAHPRLGVRAPVLRPVGRVEAEEHAFPAQHIDASPTDDRRALRESVAFGYKRAPDLIARRRVEAPEVDLVHDIALGVDAAFTHYDRRPGVTDVFAPGLGRRPDANCLRRDPVPVRPAPLGPVGRIGSHREHKHRSGQDERTGRRHKRLTVVRHRSLPFS